MTTASVLRGPSVPIAADETVHGLIEAWARSAPHREALRWRADGRCAQLTYAALVERATLRAAELRGLGVGTGAVVAVCLERSPELIISLLAILMAGGCYLPLDPSHPPEHLHFMITDSGAATLITRGRFWPSLPSAARILDLDKNPTGSQAPTASAAVGARALAYIIYTSGSTGRPKGAEITHAGIIRLVRSPFIVWSPQVFLQHSAVTFDLSTFEIWGPLLNGSVCAIADPGALSLAHLEMQIESLRVSTLWLTAGLFHAMVDHRLDCFARLSQLVAGGDALSPRHVERVLAAHPDLLVVDGYGPTEVTTFISCHRMQGPQRFPGSVPIGTPIANTDVAILGEDLLPVADGLEGELVAAGDGVARGYRNREQLTRERFIEVELPGLGRTRVYRTGDRARIRSDGLIEYLGRRDNQVKLRGFRVELDEIELALRDHPAVADAAVVFRRAGDGDGAIDGYVSLKPRAAPVSTAQGREHLQRWTSIYEATYAGGGPSDPLFHVAGWNSSYNDLPIPVEQLRELVEGTAERVRSLGAKRLAELGCGTGLLLLRLAPGLERCLGSDPAPTGLRHIEQVLSGENFRHLLIDLRTADADADLGLKPGELDVVMTNSVVQCFPDAQYLQRVVSERMLDLLVAGGTAFIGDCRNLALQMPFHASVALHRADRALVGRQIAWRIRNAAAMESQLLVDPRFFSALRRRTGREFAIRLLLKRGRHDNEMLAFRYDAVLTVGGQRPDPDLVLDWDGGAPQAIAGRNRVVVRGVANARTARYADLAQAAAAQPETAWAELIARTPARGIEPEAWYALAEQLDYDVELSWAAAAADGAYDVLLAPRGAGLPAAPEADAGTDPARWINDPLAGNKAAVIAADLKRHLREKLPAYMHPHSVQVVPVMPLNASGKIDRPALPEPNLRAGTGADHVAPETPLERELCAIWEDILGVTPIGTEDRFFDLGGTSLSAVAMIERVQQRTAGSVQLGDFLRGQTIASLSQLLGGTSARTSRLIRVKTGGAKLPMMAICEYYDIARHLPIDRPYIVIDLRYEEKVRNPDLTIDAVARRGIAAIRQHQPKGPYLLAGHSYGSVVAWEMARFCEADGERVAGVILFDPPVLSSLGVPPAQSARWFYHVKQLLKSSPDVAVARLHRALVNAKERFAQGNDDEIFADFRFQPIAAPVLSLYPRDSYLRTRPELDPRNALAKLCGDFHALDVDGDHFTLLREPHVAKLAEIVAQWLTDRRVP